MEKEQLSMKLGKDGIHLTIPAMRMGSHFVATTGFLGDLHRGEVVMAKPAHGETNAVLAQYMDTISVGRFINHLGDMRVDQCGRIQTLHIKGHTLGMKGFDCILPPKYEDRLFCGEVLTIQAQVNPKMQFFIAKVDNDHFAVAKLLFDLSVKDLEEAID